LKNTFSRSQTLACVLALSGAFCAPVAHAQNNQTRLPHIGDGNSMSVLQERRLGEAIMRQIMPDPDYLDDPVLLDYLQGIWQPLKTSARQLGNLTPELDENFSWNVFLVRDRSVNAFALPGGYMGVHLGLIAVVSSRDELAAVMGHEMSHVTQRHIARMQDSQGRQTPFMVASILLGVLAASKSPDAANAMIMGGTASVAQGQLNFSRDMEREADRMGYAVMTNAGFEGQGVVSMFQKLAIASRLNDSGGYPYLRSHPLTTERIGDMQSRMGVNMVDSKPLPLAMEHAMMAARARAMMSKRAEEVQALVLAYENEISLKLSPAQLAGLSYAAVMAYTEQRQADKALQALNRLLSLTANDPAAARAARWLAADTARRLGKTGECLSYLNELPATRARLLLQSSCRIATQTTAMLEQTSDQLQLWLADNPRDPLAWESLAQAYAQNKQPLRALRAEAEAKAVRWDEVAAIDRLRAAQALARELTQKGKLDLGGQQEASIIDARMRTLEAKRRELLQPNH